MKVAVVKRDAVRDRWTRRVADLFVASNVEVDVSEYRSRAQAIDAEPVTLVTVAQQGRRRRGLTIHVTCEEHGLVSMQSTVGFGLLSAKEHACLRHADEISHNNTDTGSEEQ